MTDVDHIAGILRRYRFLVADEKSVQEAIADALAVSLLPSEREVRLAPGDIIDFLAGSVGIEVKVKGGKRAILRQLERYADSERVASLILVTAVAIGLPAELKGKPVCIVSIGRAWL